jgi:hypothetical protein
MSVIFQPQPQHDVQVSCVVCAPVYSRGRYGELTNTISGQSVKEILAQFAPCLPGEFAQFDHRKRGDAVNWDLYGWDRAQNVAVIQIRHAWRRKATHFLSVHKTYVLAGFNEITEAPFRHPVSASAVRAAVRRAADPVGVVRAAQCWMWRVTERQLERSTRQGDVLLVPERNAPRGEIMECGTRATVGGTHEIRAVRIVQADERVYALNPRVIHLRGQHEPIGATDHDGWHSVRVAAEGRSWDFSERLGD